MAFVWLKSFHLIGIVVWFAGLFYLVRLFVYHAEAEAKPEPARTILKDQYALMESRLWKIITVPGCILTVAMATGMLWVEPSYLTMRWLQVKLALVTLLLAYHFLCGHVRKALLKGGTAAWSAKRLRALNEVPTLLLLVIVILAVSKGSISFTATGVAAGVMLVLLLAGIQLYARARRKAAEAASAG